jgi:hypothetical protein
VTKRKREDGEQGPTKDRRGAPKPKQDFEKLITDAEIDIAVSSSME